MDNLNKYNNRMNKKINNKKIKKKVLYNKYKNNDLNELSFFLKMNKSFNNKRHFCYTIFIIII